MLTLEEDVMQLDLSEENYLNNPEDWNEEVARYLASGEDIELTDEHWRVFRFMREYYADHGIAADARFVIKFIANELGYGDEARSRLFQLFPYGYVKQACMKRPRAWSTG